MDLSALSLGELRKLSARIHKEIERRGKKQRGQALDEIKLIVAKYGLKLDDVIGKAPPPNPVGVKPVAKLAKSGAIAYRHPENAALTWAGGRGRRPQWIKEWLSSGRSLDEVRVSNG